MTATDAAMGPRRGAGVLQRCSGGKWGISAVGDARGATDVVVEVAEAAPEMMPDVGVRSVVGADESGGGWALL